MPQIRGWNDTYSWVSSCTGSFDHSNIFLLWPTTTTHPANQSRAHLTEEFQIKVFDAGIELMSFEKVINHIAWRNMEGKKEERSTFFNVKQTTVKLDEITRDTSECFLNAQSLTLHVFPYQSFLPVPAALGQRSESGCIGRRWARWRWVRRPWPAAGSGCGCRWGQHPGALLLPLLWRSLQWQRNLEGDKCLETNTEKEQNTSQHVHVLLLN